MAREQLTDMEWEFIRPYLPIGSYGPYPERLRQQFEGSSRSPPAAAQYSSGLGITAGVRRPFLNRMTYAQST